MNKFKKILLGTLSVLTLGLFVVTGSKVEAATAAVDGTYTVYANSFYTTSSTGTSKIACDTQESGIFKFTTTGTNYYYTYGQRASNQGKTLTNTYTDLAETWADTNEIMTGGGRTLTVTTGTLATGQSATCTVYGYADGTKAVTINGVSSTPSAYTVTAVTQKVSSGSSFTIGLVGNFVLLQVDVVISTDTSSTYYDVNFYDGEDLVHTDSVIEGGKAASFSYAGSRWNYNFDKWLDSNDEEFDFANTTITSETNLYASYVAWGTDVIADSNTLDLSLMTKGYQIFGTGTSSSDRVLEGTIYTLLKGNTCYASTSTTVGDLGKSTAAIKTAGGLNNHQNGVSLTVEKAGTLTLWAKNGSSGSRTFGLYKDGNTSSAVDTDSVSDLAEFTLDIPEAGTYELGSTAGSVYFYYISFVETVEMADGTSAGVFAEKNTTGDTIRFVGGISGISDLANIESIELILKLNDKATKKQIFLTTCYTSVEGASVDCPAADGVYYVIYRITGAETLTGTITDQLKVTFTDGSTTLSTAVEFNL